MDLDSSLTSLAIIVTGGLLIAPDDPEDQELHEHADDDLNEESLLCSLVTSVKILLTLLVAIFWD